MKDTVFLFLRKKHPTLAKKCDYENGRAAAIRLMCEHCMGGDSDSSTLVRQCKSYDCPNWQFRLGVGSEKRPEGNVPSLNQYNEWIEAKITPEKRAWAKKLGSMKKK